MTTANQTAQTIITCNRRCLHWLNDHSRHTTDGTDRIMN